MQEEGQKV